ncbi:alkaline phosphatase family protein, partial [Bacillus mycoides]|nr:alkaline phosphatase family protein [Bacillus mycoides]
DLFSQKGLISVKKRGKKHDWKANSQSRDGAAYLHVKDKNDTETIKEIQLLLEELLQDKQNVIELILNDEDAKERASQGN